MDELMTIVGICGDESGLIAALGGERHAGRSGNDVLPAPRGKAGNG